MERLIRTHDVVGPSGLRKRALHVFCPPSQRSVDLDTCLACPFFRACVPDPDAHGAVIACAAPEPPRASPRARDAFTSVHVGEIMGAHVTCLEPSVSIADAEAELTRAGVEHLPVVGRMTRLLGVFWRRDLVPSKLGQALALRDRRRGRAATSVGECMDPRGVSVRESAPVARVIHMMVTGHVRSIAVVSELDAVVGSVTDLDLLGWFASVREEPPSSDRAT